MAWYQFNISNDINAPSSRECHSINVRNESLILFGGNDNSSRMHDVYLMDTTTMKWSRLPPEGDAPVKRSAHSSALIDNRYMYVFGGWDGSTELGDIGVFDLVTKKWSKPKCTGTPPVPRHFHNTVFVGRHMYIFGGYDGTAWRNDMIALNVDTLHWDAVKTEDPSCTGPGPRASGSCVLIDQDKLLIFGGYNGDDFLNDMWILHTKNPVTGQLSYRWEQIKEPKLRKNEKSTWPSPRSGHAIEVFGNLLLIIGGRYKLGRFNDIVIFNLHTLTWHEYTPSGELFKPRKTHAIGRVGYQLWLFGGHDGTSWLGDLHMLDLRAIEKQFLPRLCVTIPSTTIYKDYGTLINVSIDDILRKEKKTKQNYMSALLFSNGKNMMIPYGSLNDNPNEDDTNDDDNDNNGTENDPHYPNLSFVSEPDQVMNDYTEWTNNSIQQQPMMNDSNHTNSTANNNGLYSLASYEKYFRDRNGERKNNIHFLTPLSPNTSFTTVTVNNKNNNTTTNTPINHHPDTLIDHDDQVSLPSSTAYPVASSSAGSSTLHGEGPTTATATSHMLTSPHPPSQPVPLQQPHHHSVSLSSYPSVFPHPPSFTDVTFLIENKSIQLHKCILASRCEYFRLMFSSTFTESQMSIIPLPEIELSVFMVIVRYLYIDQLPNEDELNALCIPLLTQAQKMNLPRLSRLCQRYMETALCPENAPVMLEVADTYNTRPLRKACIQYILQNYIAVSRSPGFIDLREDLLREILLRHARYEEQLEEDDSNPASSRSNVPKTGTSMMTGTHEHGSVSSVPSQPSNEPFSSASSNTLSTTGTTTDAMILVHPTTTLLPTTPGTIVSASPMTILSTNSSSTAPSTNSTPMTNTSTNNTVNQLPRLIDPELGIPVTVLSNMSNNNNHHTMIYRTNSTNLSNNDNIFRQLSNLVPHGVPNHHLSTAGATTGTLHPSSSPSTTASSMNAPSRSVSASRRRSLLNHHFDTLDNTLLNVHQHRTTGIPSTNHHPSRHSSNATNPANNNSGSISSHTSTVTSPQQRIMMRMQQAHEQYQQQHHRPTISHPLSSPSSSTLSSPSTNPNTGTTINNNSTSNINANQNLLNTFLDPNLFATLMEITRTMPNSNVSSSSSNTATGNSAAQLAAAMMLAAAAADTAMLSSVMPQNVSTTTGSNNTSLSSALNVSQTNHVLAIPNSSSSSSSRNSTNGGVPSATKRRRHYTENSSSTDTSVFDQSMLNTSISSLPHDNSLVPYDLLSEASEYDDNDSSSMTNNNSSTTSHHPGYHGNSHRIPTNDNEDDDDDDILPEEDIHDMDIEHHRASLLNRSSTVSNGTGGSGSSSSTTNSTLTSPSSTPFLPRSTITTEDEVSIAHTRSNAQHHRKGIIHGGDDHSGTTNTNNNTIRSVAYQEIIDAITNGGGIPTPPTASTVLPDTLPTHHHNHHQPSFLPITTTNMTNTIDTSFSHGGGGSGSNTLLTSPLNLSVISPNNSGILMNNSTNNINNPSTSFSLPSNMLHGFVIPNSSMNNNNNPSVNTSTVSVNSVHNTPNNTTTSPHSSASVGGKRRRSGHTVLAPSNNNTNTSTSNNSSNHNGGE